MSLYFITQDDHRSSSQLHLPNKRNYMKLSKFINYLACFIITVHSLNTFSMDYLQKAYTVFLFTKPGGTPKSHFNGMPENIFNAHVKPYVINILQNAYEDTRLTRSYGILKSNFDCLPMDILKTDIKPHIANMILTALKHAILTHNFITWNHDITRFETKEDIVFQHHDGSYTLAPAEYEYAMWDQPLIGKRKFTYFKNGLTKHSEKYYCSFRGIKQDKSPFLIGSPQPQFIECKVTNIAINDIENTGALMNYSFKTPIQYATMSSDHQWLALTFAPNNLLICINLNSYDFGYSFRFPSPIIALCSAHHSPLLCVCLQDGNCRLIQPNILHKSSNYPHNNIIHIAAQFSPDDKYMMMYGTKHLHFIKTKSFLNENKKLKKKYFTSNIPIRKVFFTPDSKRMVMAMTTGKIYSLDCNRIIKEENPLINNLNATWRCEEVANIDNQAPLMLFSTKNQLLFTLDPAQHTADDIYTFVIRDIRDGKPLKHYDFVTHNPRAMGLTKDERTVVFIHHDDSTSRLNLYTDEDMEHFTFIEQDANLYHLSRMFEIFKNYEALQPKKHKNKISKVGINTFVTAMRSYIKNYTNKEK